MFSLDIVPYTNHFLHTVTCITIFFGKRLQSISYHKMYYKNHYVDFSINVSFNATFLRHISVL